MSLHSLSPDLAFDPTPLTEPVDPRHVDDHHRRLTAARQRTGGDVLFWIVAPIIALFGLVPLVMLFTDLARLRSGPVIIACVIGGTLALVSVVTLRVRRRLRKDREIRYRLSRFAAANAMTYQPRVANPSHPGMIFSIGGDRFTTDVLRTETQPTVEYGHHHYLVKSGKHAVTFSWGYIAIELGTTLPHIVLDSARNNSALGSNLPTAFRPTQRLSLEGDFDQYFELYCPEGYERDALYLFSPDIMARFVDHAASFDAEIVDNTLFLYTGPGISTTSPEMWAWLFGTVNALQSKVDQWARWRDDRLQPPSGSPSESFAVAPTSPPPQRPPGVAATGRRLRRGWERSTLWIAVGATVFALIGLGLQTL